MRFPSGTILFGKYRIDRLIGKGGFAEVYLATHLELQTYRAVKIILRDAHVTNDEFKRVIQRFRLEARLGAQFAREPHIVRVYDFVSDIRQGVLALIMEYLPGGSLKNRIQDARVRGRPGLPVELVIQTAYQVALGLAALHRAELVHRDIKPSNILYDADGTAKIADLGIVQAKLGLTHRSRYGASVPPHPGTPAYMSPEQEASVAYLPPASDVYSLGLTLFEALTLHSYKHLRPGTRVHILRPDVPAWLDELIARMLAEKPDERPWDGEEVAWLIKKNVAKSRPQYQKYQRGEEVQDKEETSSVFSSKLAKTFYLPFIAFILLFLFRILNSFPHPLGENSSPSVSQPTFSPSITLTVSPTMSLITSPTTPPTPPYTGPVTMATPLPLFLLRPITVANAADVQLIARWGKGALRSSAWSPKGDLFAVSSALGIYLYNPTTFREVQHWETPFSVIQIDFSPDGAFIASASDDGVARIWNVSDGKLLYSLGGHRQGYMQVAFSPDGKLLATTSGSTIRLWRTEDGTLVHQLEGHVDVIADIAFSSDGDLIASTACTGTWICIDGDIRVWRTTDGALLQTFQHKSRSWSIAFAPNNRWLVSGTEIILSRYGTLLLER